MFRQLERAPRFFCAIIIIVYGVGLWCSWGRCPQAPTSFSCLDARKGSKRKSRRQGRRPDWEGTGCVYVMYWAHFPSPGRGRQGRRPDWAGTGCVYVMYRAHFLSPGRGRQGRRPDCEGTGCVYVMYWAHFPSPGRGRQGRRPDWAGTGCVYVMYRAHFLSPGRGRQGRRLNRRGARSGFAGGRSSPLDGRKITNLRGTRALPNVSGWRCLRCRRRCDRGAGRPR